MDILRRKKTNKSDFERRDFLERKYQEGVANSENDVYSYSFGHKYDEDKKSFVSDGIYDNKPLEENNSLDIAEKFDNSNYQASDFFEENLDDEEDFETKEKKSDGFNVNNVSVEKRTFSSGFLFRKSVIVSIFLLTITIFGGYSFFNRGQQIKKQVLGVSDEAYNNIDLAIAGIKDNDFSLSVNKFNEAYENFSEISNILESLGDGTIRISKFIPGASKLSSGYHLSQAGKQLALSGKKISQLAQTLDDLKKGKVKTAGDNNEKMPILNIFESFKKDLDEVRGSLDLAQKNLNQVKTADLPLDKRGSVINLKNKLAIIIMAVDSFSDNSYIVADLLGANGPRKYLFLFQNNQEMRATGGFIGSYGVLSIDSRGQIKNFFVDGIFNPDGQLTEKIVPPKPIQKISTAWSMHDSNWFPDFPLSAKKAMLFYEKTGGATVDGIIAITPTVMQKLLTITGPIVMENYDIVLTADNFVQNIQYEVEEDYDKEENKPKKILSDLAPIVLNKIFSSDNSKTIAKTMEVLNESLTEKQILFYSSNDDLQKIISKLGWSGEILQTQKDYLSVVNTNINGYKTDGVVNEKINQQINILPDGSIVDTVTITRIHNGGNKEYDWWNKVNADYMRVYVPKGSKLLEVEGQTKEVDKSPVDYNALNFKRDIDVEREEKSIKIDADSGTRIYDEFGKTVFANWVYVSPQEKVVVKYKYLLPFKISFSKDNPASTYSVLAQKQSGSFGSDYSLQITYPKKYHSEWKSDNLKTCASLSNEDVNEERDSICLGTILTTDKFSGLVLSRR